MNIELKPIAESKVRQLGGDVCGVLVRDGDGTVMAVSEHGRCTRLDDGVMGPVDPEARESLFSERDLFLMKEAMNAGQYYESLEDWLGEVISDGGHTVEQHLAHDAHQKQAARAQGGQAVEPTANREEAFNIACVFSSYSRDALAKKGMTAEKHNAWFQILKAALTNPQPAQQGVPEAMTALVAICQHLRDYVDNSGTSIACDRGVNHFLDALKKAEEVTEQALSTTPQPEGDGWVKCEDRLPSEADADLFGEVLVFDHGKLVRRAIETVLNLAQNTHHGSQCYWMPTGLKRPQPPAGQGGEGDE